MGRWRVSGGGWKVNCLHGQWMREASVNFPWFVRGRNSCFRPVSCRLGAVLCGAQWVGRGRRPGAEHHGNTHSRGRSTVSTPSGSPSKIYALKFISGKYQGGEFPLKADKQIVIGRSSELDMVLVEDMVSRKHARIMVNGIGQISIEDLGSTNGTFVNGEKVKQATLKEGDRILIGTSILKLILQGAGVGEVDEVVAKQRLEEAAVQAARTSTKASSMTG